MNNIAKLERAIVLDAKRLYRADQLCVKTVIGEEYDEACVIRERVLATLLATCALHDRRSKYKK
jgi:hypothetical protein